MVNIDRVYVTIAIVLLIAGMLLGVYMGIAADNSLVRVHVAMMLVGFVTLAIYGFLFRLWPDMKKGRLAAVQFWLSAIGAIGIVIGAYQFAVTGAIVIVVPASALFIVATLLLAWLFWASSASSTQG